MTTTSPEPFPLAGQRGLTVRETLQRLNALKCTLPPDNRPRCSGPVFVGLFFDGTGNNMRLDYELPPPEKRKHTNVVKLFLAHRDDPVDGKLRYYMPGVGTPFPEIGDDGGTRGSAFAYKGEDRIIWAFTRLVNAPNIYVTGGPLIDDALAKTITANLASSTSPGAMRRVALNTWQDKLRSALQGRKPRVEQINLSVFGFSRGAAEARAFVNWLFEVCRAEGGGWTFAGIPIRVMFLGLFDTVASVGLANLSEDGTFAGHQSWGDNTLQIHPAVERCVHYVAGHEVRACFPLDSVRIGHAYPANAQEVMYPGAHSDVGGGYAPGALGVCPTPADTIAVIPGVRMYHEALKAGVPLRQWSELPEALQKALTPTAEVIRDFNAYLRAARTAAAPVEQLHRRHMGLYLSYRFKRRHDFERRPPYTAASRAHQAHLRTTQASLIARLRGLGQGDPLERGFDPRRAARLLRSMNKAAGLQIGTREQQLCEVAEHIDEAAVTPEVEAFFERHVHDSMAGFIDMGVNEYAYNRLGLAKFRSVFKGND